MRRILVRWLINAIALYVAIYVLGDTRIGYDGGWGGLFTMAAIVGLVNAVIGPFLKFLSCPLIILTLGLFTLIINAVLLQVAASFGNLVGIPFHLDSFGSAFLASLIISAVSILLTILIGEPARKKH